MSINAFGLLQKLKNTKPVVHHITNWVTIYQCAEIVKAFGGSPVMAHASQEAADMAGIASSLVLNIGTLTEEIINSMKIAGLAANKKGIPVILDVCGAGATKHRDEKCAELLKDVRVDVIKGNSSEIARIAGENVFTKGVDSADVNTDMKILARNLAKQRNCTVVVTGKTDIVTNGTVNYQIHNGCDMMTHVVGTGCMAASVIGIFCAVEKDYALAASAGLVCFEIAAELANQNAAGPGTFLSVLFDEAYKLDKESLDRMIRVEP